MHLDLILLKHCIGKVLFFCHLNLTGNDMFGASHLVITYKGSIITYKGSITFCTDEEKLQGNMGTENGIGSPKGDQA
jgi:hypothetical protein